MCQYFFMNQMQMKQWLGRFARTLWVVPKINRARNCILRFIREDWPRWMGLGRRRRWDAHLWVSLEWMTTGVAFRTARLCFHSAENYAEPVFVFEARANRQLQPLRRGAKPRERVREGKWMEVALPWWPQQNTNIGQEFSLKAATDTAAIRLPSCPANLPPT